MRLSELAGKLGMSVVGDDSIEVTGVATLDEAGPGDVAFLANVKYTDRLATTKAGAVCVADGVTAERLNLLVSKDPYFTFCRVVVELVGHRKHPFVGVHPLAFVDPTATVGPGTTIYPFAFVGPRATVGANCILYPGACVYDECVLGDRVILHANTVIGLDGFGYATHGGVHHKIPQVGNVIVESDVEFGSCSTAQRATLGSTVLGTGTKLGDVVVIGHGCKIGQHNLLISQVGISGSTSTGKYVTMAGQVGVTGHLKIGSNIRVGAQSGVMDDLVDNVDVLGSPAVDMKEARKIYVATFKLPELVKRVRELEREVARLKDAIVSVSKEENAISDQRPID